METKKYLKLGFLTFFTTLWLAIVIHVLINGL